jgi:hypothetical protein
VFGLLVGILFWNEKSRMKDPEQAPLQCVPGKHLLKNQQYLQVRHLFDHVLETLAQIIKMLSQVAPDREIVQEL